MFRCVGAGAGSVRPPGPAGLPGAGPTSTSVLAAVVAVLAIALGTGLVVRWRGRRHVADPGGDAETAVRLRRLRRRGLLGGWLLTLAVTTLLDGHGTVAGAIPGVVPGAVGLSLSVLLTVLGPLVPVALAVRLATVPYRDAVRGLRTRYRDAAAWELERDGVGLGGILVAAVVIALAPPGWGRVLTAVGLGLVATAVTPFALVVALRTRWPTDAERATLAGVLDGTHLRIVDDRTRIGSAFAAGVVPGARYVFLTESLFEVLDEDELRAVVAHEVGHHARNHVLLRYSVLALAAGGALGLVEAFPPETALAAVVVCAVPFAVGFARVVRVTERRADDYAVATVGGAALASALERLAARRYVMESTGVLAVLAHHPPLGERIADLRRGPVR